MTPTPLHRMAEAGREALAQRASRINDHGGKFASRVKNEGMVSVNMRPNRLLAFLKTGFERTPFDRARLAAEAENLDYGACLREILTEDWADRRITFEDWAGEGSHFHYGALNLGGPGLVSYGGFCVVDLRRGGEASPDPVWLLENSLTGEAFWSGDELSHAGYEGCLAISEGVSDLALVKFGEATSLSAEELCSDEAFIEALSLESLRTEAVLEIRSAQSAQDQKRALTAELSGADPAEEVNLDVLVEIKCLADRLGISWVSE